MRGIIIVRHATAVARDESKPDFSRKLRKKGQKEAQKLARRLLKHQTVPDLIITSAAPRATETAEVFAEVLGCEKSTIQSSQDLYDLGDPFALLSLIRLLDSRHKTVMLVGHDPLLSDFAQLMVPDFNAFLPKCGVLHFSTKRKFWRNVQEGDGTLEFFEYPVKVPDKKVIKSAIKDEFAASLQQNLTSVFAAFRIKDAKAEKEIKKTSKALAKAFADSAKVDYYDYYIENLHKTE